MTPVVNQRPRYDPMAVGTVWWLPLSANEVGYGTAEIAGNNCGLTILQSLKGQQANWAVPTLSIKSEGIIFSRGDCSPACWTGPCKSLHKKDENVGDANLEVSAVFPLLWYPVWSISLWMLGEKILKYFRHGEMECMKTDRMAWQTLCEQERQMYLWVVVQGAREARCVRFVCTRIHSGCVVF